MTSFSFSHCTEELSFASFFCTQFENSNDVIPCNTYNRSRILIFQVLNNLNFSYCKNHFICSLLVLSHMIMIICSFVRSFIRVVLLFQLRIILKITHEINCLSLSGFIFAEIFWLLWIGQHLGYHCNFHNIRLKFQSAGKFLQCLKGSCTCETNLNQSLLL